MGVDAGEKVIRKRRRACICLTTKKWDLRRNQDSEVLGVQALVSSRLVQCHQEARIQGSILCLERMIISQSL